jgi:TRAP-type C4-dicarboxylate transport system substrate-binding protein
MIRSVRTRALVVAVTLGAVLLGAGCQVSPVVDKTGSRVVVLRLASIDTLSAGGQFIAPMTFVNALARRSGGQVKAQVQQSYESGAATAETDIVKGIASGDLDGGWPTTRAFSRAGIRGLEPVEAPFTLTSYAAEKALVSRPEAGTLLDTLHGTGVVGLGLAVGPLRRPWAVKQPLVDVQNWRGLTFRSFNSPVQDAVVRALGATPVAASYDFPDLVRAGSLGGAEADVPGYDLNSYGSLLPEAVANEVLWPKMYVLALSRARYDSLSEQQRGWVREAAADAVRASVNVRYEEDIPARRLCSRGVRFVDATPAQLAALRHAVQPVVDGLADDPATGPSLKAVLAVAAGFPSADALTVPASCRKP